MKMKTTIKLITIVIAAVSFNAAADQAQAQEAVSHASRMLSAAEARVNDAQKAYNDAAYQQGSGVNGSAAEVNLNRAASDRAAAQAQMNGAISTLANAVATGPVQGPVVNATSYRLGITQRQQKAISSINVAASSLNPSTQITATINGVTQTTTAGDLAPTTQVAIPHIAAFEREGLKGGVNGKASHNVSHGSSDNNGQANAHASAFGGGRNADGAHLH
jgi:hypothetical protein